MKTTKYPSTCSPGVLDQIFPIIILRIYKIPDGKPENKFAFDGEYQDAEFANKIIAETHLYWKQLVGKFY